MDPFDSASETPEGAWVRDWLSHGIPDVEQDAQGLDEIAHDLDESESEEERMFDSETSSGELGSDETDDPPNFVEPDWSHRKRRKAAEKDTAPDADFLYNGRIALVAIPGALLVLMLGSDLLLTVLAIGGFAVYLFYISENKEMTTSAFLISFICAYIIIIYSSVPLLWKSLYNAVLVMCVNVYTALTGGWIMVGFRMFRVKEPELIRFIETSLFSIYPAICAILITWFIVLFTSIHIAPYCLLILGFVILQHFMVPTVSSFIKFAQGENPNDYVLQPSLTAAVALMYSASVPTVFLAIQGSMGLHRLFSVCTLFEWLFLTSTCVFLSTFFNLRQFMEITGIDYKYVTFLRWTSSFCGVSCLSPLLSCYQVQSSLLPWLPAVTALFGAFGFILMKRSKLNALIMSSILIFAFVAITILHLPWNLKLPSFDGTLQNFLHFFILLNALLSVLCIYSSSYARKDVFGLLLFAQSLCTFTCEVILNQHDLCSNGVIIIISIAAIYISTRLMQSELLLWQHALLMTSFHAAISLKHSLFTNEAITFVVDFLALWFLLAIVAYIFIFQTMDKLTNKQVIFLCSVLITALIFNAPLLASSVSISVSACIGLYWLVMTCCLLKWMQYHQIPDTYLKVIVFPSLLISMVLIILQPQTALTWAACQEWLIVLSVMCLVSAVPILLAVRDLHKFLGLLGCPVGITLIILGFPESYSPLLCVLGAFAAYSCSDIAIHLWLQLGEFEKRIFFMSYFLGCVLMIGLLRDGFLYSQSELNLSEEIYLLSPGLTLTVISVLWLAIALKIWSISGQAVFMTKEGVAVKSRLPLLGNICAVLSFISLNVLQPLVLPELWVCLISTVLLLLQNDRKFFYKLSTKNNLVPVFTVISGVLISSTIIRSSLWSFSGILCILSGLAELLLTCATIPVIGVFLAAKWSVELVPHSADRLVIFICPLGTLLMFVWSSYSTLCLAVWSIGSGIWSVSYLLPSSRV